MDHSESPTELTELPEIEDIEIISLLGKGGMSLVYKARQKRLDRIVAVKLLSKMAVRGEAGIKRFQKEAKLTSTLDHPNIVKTISFGLSKDGQPYLVMEYLEGLSLADDLKQNGRLKLQKFKDVFLPVLSALGQAHLSGVIHRDIKPGNIMICRNENGTEYPKLFDFGIAKIFCEEDSETQNLTKSGSVLGSPSYMSPEQCQGKPLDGRSDLYSVACVMYETLRGEPPFSGDSLLEVMQKHSTAPPPTVEEVSRKIDIHKELARVTLWGLAKDPAARPQTASEFALKLNEVLESITLDRVPLLKNSAAVLKISGMPLMIVLLSLCLALAATYFVERGRPKKKPEPPLVLSAPERKIQAFKHQLEKFEKSYNDADPVIAKKLSELAELYKDEGKYAEAEPLLKRALKINEKIVGSRHDQEVADTLLSLAVCARMLGRTTEAVKLLRRCIAIDERIYGPEHYNTANPIFQLAICYQQEAKYVEAEQLYKHSLALWEEYDPNDIIVAKNLKMLADFYISQNLYPKAEPLLKRALAIAEKNKIKGPELAEYRNALAECSKKQDK